MINRNILFWRRLQLFLTPNSTSCSVSFSKKWTTLICLESFQKLLTECICNELICEAGRTLEEYDTTHIGVPLCSHCRCWWRSHVGGCRGLPFAVAKGILQPTVPTYRWPTVDERKISLFKNEFLIISYMIWWNVIVFPICFSLQLLLGPIDPSPLTSYSPFLLIAH